MLSLRRVNEAEAETLWCMQREAFSDLLIKYQDFETSPANESLESIQLKLRQAHSYVYFIYVNKDLVGAIRVVDRQDASRKRVAPIFIMNEFRNRGIAQAVFHEIEKMHGKRSWALDTILQESGLCHLYEKLGYQRTGRVDTINEKMDIVYYIKD